jgi:hypothetical protein
MQESRIGQDGVDDSSDQVDVGTNSGRYLSHAV